MARFLIVGDLHGAMPKIHAKDFDGIIAPGDFCSDAHRKYIFEAMRRNIENPSKRKKIKPEDIAGKRRYALMHKKSQKDGRKILARLNSFGVPVFVVPGNWEPPTRTWLTMTQGLKNIRDLHYKKRVFEDLDFIGYGYVSAPEYPQYKEDKERLPVKSLKKRKRVYGDIQKRLSKLFRKAKRPVVFLSHNVPFNTKVDTITDKSSPKVGYHYGSLVARNLIEKYQPLVCIGGHMHEHFGKDKIGKTVVINAGFGANVNTLLEITDGKIKKLEFIQK